VGHSEVSRLSPWIRYRVVTEEECLNTVLAHHSFEVAEKFVQELVWRTYWKGWLELRPQVWGSYRESVVELQNRHSTEELYRQATEGTTGLSFFDDWVQELRLTGYLHNHTRMWFASVWIFTLRLPWQLGADFMYRHLLDGDPASNTLSWRWVGGLHTPGKIYVARPDNIDKYSDGRWRPRSSELNLSPQPLPMDDVGPMVPLQPIPGEALGPGGCVIVHDLSQELCTAGSHFLYWKGAAPDRSPVVREHLEALRTDVEERLNAVSVADAEALLGELSRRSCTKVHIMKPLCGEVQHEISVLSDTLTSHGIQVVFHRRGWDAEYLPFARSGFFSFWSAVKSKLHVAS
jgi:deoxyribodipyrimidine photo-lyase